MSDKQLLGVVEEAQISLELDGESLVVKGSKGRVNEKVKNYLVENKASIVDFLKSGVTLDGRNGIRVPRNAIEPRCAVITPQMLPLIDLRREDIDRIVLQVPGGVDNIQDIYGLTPLQDGILFAIDWLPKATPICSLDRSPSRIGSVWTNFFPSCSRSSIGMMCCVRPFFGKDYPSRRMPCGAKPDCRYWKLRWILMTVLLPSS